MCISPLFFLFGFSWCAWWAVAWGLCFGCFVSIFFWYLVGVRYQVPFSFLYLDYFSSYLVSLTFFVSFRCIAARRYRILFKNRKRKVLFLVSILGSCVVLVFSFLCSNFFSFFYFFECSLVPIIFLILNWGVQPERLLAVKYISLYMFLGSVPLWLILSTLNEAGYSLFYFLLNFENKVSLEWWFFCFLVFLIKLPIFPFHLWLPKAHVEAPVSGSIILAGVMLKLGVYGIIRRRILFFYVNSFYIMWLASVCCWGGFLCCIICWRQVDIKMAIAYASIGHIAFCCVGVLRNNLEGYVGRYFMCLAHGIRSCGLFYLANCYYEVYKSRKILLIKGGLVVCPSLAFISFLLLCCNFGFPPRMNWLAELLLYNRVIRISRFFVVLFLLISFFTSVYSIHLYSALNHGHVSEYVKKRIVHGEYLILSQILLHVFFLFVGLIFIK